MGFIKEEIKHPTIEGIEIVVDEQMKDETREPYNIVSLDVPYSSIRTPNEMADLGKWLIEQSAIIKCRYNSKGGLRKGFS